MIITNTLLVAILVREIIKENKCKKKKNVFVKGRDKILVADIGGGVSIRYEPGSLLMSATKRLTTELCPCLKCSQFLLKYTTEQNIMARGSINIIKLSSNRVITSEKILSEEEGSNSERNNVKIYIENKFN